jgi:hypothetical protein
VTGEATRQWWVALPLPGEAFFTYYEIEKMESQT